MPIQRGESWTPRHFFSAIGSVTAVVGIMACSAVGVGAVLAASEPLFHAIKWFGVGYLLYIGIATLRSTTSSFDLPVGMVGRSSRKALYAKGFLVGASNPKALLFFTAFFPQFINPAASQLYQFAILGGTFVFFELFWLMSYAAFAFRLSPWLRAKGRAKAFNWLSGVTFIGAGGLLATVRRVAKDT